MSPDLSTLRVEVYTRSACCLCDEAVELLEAVQRERGFSLVEHSIVEDPGWFSRYRHRVPVVLVDGVERLELRVTRAALEAVLDERRRVGDERGRE